MRQCALTRELKPVAELLRFVLGPDGTIVPDVDARAEGRGVWLTLSSEAIRAAIKKRVFAKSLGGEVKVPADLDEGVRTRLEDKFLGAIGLARKAGQLAIGATSVGAAAQKGEILGLITASDAAEDGRRKMLGLIRPEEGEMPIPHFEQLTSHQLDLALGRINVIHAALINGAAANSALVRGQRLALYLGQRVKEDRV